MVNGCTEYVCAMADIYFEKDKVACAYCPMLETYARNQCRKTGEYLVGDTRYTRGRWCPLLVLGEDNFENRKEEE